MCLRTSSAALQQAPLFKCQALGGGGEGFQVISSMGFLANRKVQVRSSICCSCVRATLSSCLEQEIRDFELTQLTQLRFRYQFDLTPAASLRFTEHRENIQSNAATRQRVWSRPHALLGILLCLKDHLLNLETSKRANAIPSD